MSMLTSGRPLWLLVPAIAFGGVGIGFILGLSEMPVSMNPGAWGCVIGSVLLAIIAYLKPRMDIVALLAPMYALLIFNPYSEFNIGILLQVLYSATITAVAFRLEKRFSEKAYNAIS